ncbi:ATP-binding cassette domain-containing protein [Streptomyces sp. NPDC012589]|uniref:ATP-binding cassette domain-containing protein n=1 Tax=Streptomyces sp. NPDC012589 TaxID=3364839 RepID=UPI0036C82846
MTLEISRCTYGYRRGVHVLDELSLTFGRGCTVLLGPNGAGKSTLLGVAATAIEPDSGRVSLRGWSPTPPRPARSTGVGSAGCRSR